MIARRPSTTCRSLLSHLRLRLTERRPLIVEVPARKDQIPVGLLDERQLIHQHLLELTVGQVGGAPAR